MKNKKIVIALAAALIILAGGLFALSRMNQPQSHEGSKTIEVVVVFEDGTQKEHTIQTQEEFLRGALEQEKLISGTESQYGLYVTTVDGITADETKKQWWCFNDKDGTMLNTGVDATPIADGDSFQIVLDTY